MELRHLNTTFHIQHTTNSLQGKKSELYLLYTLKNIFWMRNLNHKWTKSKPFFPTFGHFIQFSEKGGEAVPPASCGPLNNPLFSYLFKTMSWISIKVFFSKCDQIGRKLQSFSHLLKKSLKENLILYLFLLRRNREFFFKVSVILRKLRHKPAAIYLFNVSDRSTRTMSEVCWKLTIKSPEVKFLFFFIFWKVLLFLVIFLHTVFVLLFLSCWIFK